MSFNIKRNPGYVAGRQLKITGTTGKMTAAIAAAGPTGPNPYCPTDVVEATGISIGGLSVSGVAGPVSGALTITSPSAPQRGVLYYANFFVLVGAEAGNTYQIDLSGTFDTYMYLLSGPCTNDGTITSDDDAGPGTDSRITWTPSTTGNYAIVCTSYGTNATGTLSVTVTRTA